MPSSKKQAGRQIQPSDRWGMTREIMGMCLTLQGMEKKQRPVEIAGNLMMAHPLSPFRQQVKQLLCCPPEALWLRLGQVLHEVLQLAIAYECQGLEWNFSGVLVTSPMSSRISQSLEIRSSGCVIGCSSC